MCWFSPLFITSIRDLPNYHHSRLVRILAYGKPEMLGETMGNKLESEQKVTAIKNRRETWEMGVSKGGPKRFWSRYMKLLNGCWTIDLE